MRLTKSMVGSWVAAFSVCCLLSPAVLSGQEKNNNNDREHPQEFRISPDDVQLPEALQQLDLEEEQEDAIRRAIAEHNEQILRVWQRQHLSYMQAVQLEALMLAGIQGQLTEEQKEEFQRVRMQQLRAAERQEVFRPERGEHHEHPERREHPERPEQPEQPQPGQPQPEEPQPGQIERERAGVIGVLVLSPADQAEEISLTAEQREQVEEIRERLQPLLAQRWQEVRVLHTRRVQLEADKLLAIEDALTEEQLEELKRQRAEFERRPEVEIEVEENDDNDENDNNNS